MQQLDDQDFTDYIALSSHSRQQIQRKTVRLEKTAAQLGLKINRQKTKLMKINTQSMEPVELEAGAEEEFNSFTVLTSEALWTNKEAQKISERELERN